MPTSNLVVWPAILHYVWEVQPSTILDVGPGHGKAGILLREYVGSPPIRCVDAVEVERSYCTDRVAAMYDTLWNTDVRKLDDYILASYDLVLMVDVIEHMPKKDGLRLIERIPGHIVVCTPRDFFDNPPGLPASERHVSHWKAKDFGPRVDREDRKALQAGAVLVRLSKREG